MAEFLTTRGISLYIEEIIKTAEKEITIVTPFLKFSNVLFERLLIADKKNITITIIYGKADLSKEQDAQLKRLKNLNLYFLEHLHAKCYHNENQLIITSMNLYQFSEENNWEMGLLLNIRNDRKTFDEVLKEIDSYKLASVEKKKSQNEQTSRKVDYSYDEFNLAYFNKLSKMSPQSTFSLSGREIKAVNFPFKGVEFDNQNGFVNLRFNCSKDKGKLLKDKFYDKIQMSLRNYRVYWNSPYDRICVYRASSIEFNNLEDDINYCLEGIEKIKIEVNEMLN